MHRHTIYILLLATFYGLVLATITGCGRKNATEDVIITVNDPGEKLFPIDDYFQVEKRVYVSAEGEYLLSDIHDIYVTNDYAFILDYSQSISKSVLPQLKG